MEGKEIIMCLLGVGALGVIVVLLAYIVSVIRESIKEDKIIKKMISDDAEKRREGRQEWEDMHKEYDRGLKEGTI